MVVKRAPARRLDVVAELSAHQQNVEPPPVQSRAALIALPLPPICGLIALDLFDAKRALVLKELAIDLGGGDGPLLVVDLAATGAPLSQRLGALWEAGARVLHVHGTREQPGYARALGYRWPGGLHVLPSDPHIDALLDPRESIRWLAPGVVCLAPSTPSPANAERVLAAVDADGDPRRVREEGPHVWPYAPDPERRLAPWSGVVPLSGASGSPRGGDIRARWDAHWAALGQPDPVRAAVLGLDAALETALRDPREPEPPTTPEETPARPSAPGRVIAITGIDGSGKSSHVARLARALGDRGARVSVLKLYRQGAFLDLANELSGRTRRGAPLAVFRTSRVVKLVDSLRVYRDQMRPALADCDVVVMDRYVETHVAAAASQLGWDLSEHPALAPFPRADLRFWLETDPEIALRRRDARAERATADEHSVGLSGYAREFARLAVGPREVRLDAAAKEDDNARAIIDSVLAAGHSSRGPATESRVTSPSARAARDPSAQRCKVNLGPAATLPELGADVLTLRAALVDWCGSRAAGVPEAFWLEAYGAQLVLDLRTLGPEQASIALWPGALVRMQHHTELSTLRELERMLLPHVEIVSCKPVAEASMPSFVALGAARVAAERLAHDYAVQLRQLAIECGWPIEPSR